MMAVATLGSTTSALGAQKITSGRGLKGTGAPELQRWMYHQPQRQRAAAGVRRARGDLVRVSASTAGRLAPVGRSYAKTWTEAIVSPQENPELMMGTLLDDMGRDVQELRRVYSQVEASKLQMQKRAAETQKAIRMWTDRAEAAVKAEKDDLARYALRQRINAQELMKTQQPQLAQLEAAADSLRNNLVTMQDKMAVARMRAPTLKARYAAAQAAQIIADSVDSFQSRTDTAFAALNKMEEKINALEYEAAAFLPTGLTPDMALETRFEKAIEDDLIAGMRRQLRS
mmetsp:Transcript_6636/g.19122  ORF Transcript_6636/g.19122 Transcript_6636/m.19122 type:complete len:286 (-) Transcript_6636:274-1131(-)